MTYQQLDTSCCCVRHHKTQMCCLFVISGETKNLQVNNYDTTNLMINVLKSRSINNPFPDLVDILATYF
jgi:hypothetical protein